MSEILDATIVVPTTGDRGLLLPYSVGSIQRQTVSEIEIFVVGDGVNKETRNIILDMQTNDNRIHFFDHPKHERRGETYRHEALQTARGKIICYLCDRDLMLKNHVERMLDALSQADLAYSHRIGLKENGSFHHYHKFPGIGPRPLSMGAHTREYYQKLPYGWRTTPPDIATDIYMWDQFIDQADCRITALYFCSIIYLKRGSHPGLSTPERLIEIKQLFEEFIDPGKSDYEQKVYRDLIVKEEIFHKMKSRLRKIFFGLPVDRYLEKSIMKKLFNS